MRHYCNRQQPKNRVTNRTDKVIENKEQPKEKAQEEKNDEAVIFPPNVDFSVLGDTGIKMNTYNAEVCPEVLDYGEAQGGAVSQRGGYRKQLIVDAEESGEYIDKCSYLSGQHRREMFADNMSGKFDIISIPQNREKPRVLNSMMLLLEKYKGKYICLDLWNNDSIRVEKCGYLEDIDGGFIIMQNPTNDEVTMLDLNTIKYVSVYCR